MTNLFSHSVETSERVTVELDPAGPGSRAAAFLLDLGIRFSFLFAALFASVALAGPNWFPTASGWAWALLILFLFCIEWMYHILFEWLAGGQTPGKQLLGLRVVTWDGRPIGLAEAVTRNLLRTVDFLPAGYGLGVLFLLFHPKTLRIGDLAAGTIVVREEGGDLSLYENRHAFGVGLGGPPGLFEDVFQAADEGILSPREYEVVLSYLDRSQGMAPAARERVRQEIARMVEARRRAHLAERSGIAALRRIYHLPALAFITRRKTEWERLSAWLDRLGSKTGAHLSREEILRTASLYRRTSSDLSVARAQLRGTQALRYLNHLMLRAHHRLSIRRLRRARDWTRLFLTELPALLALHRRALVCATLLFAAGGLLGASLVFADEKTIEILLPARSVEGVRSGRLWTEHIFGVAPPNYLGAAIARNNLTVSFTAFALGITAGLGTVLILLLNGFLLGGVFAFTSLYGLGGNLLRFVTPHGVVEIPVILIAGAAGLRMGAALLAPGDAPRGQALRLAAREGGLLTLGAALYLLPAGLIEGFLSPSDIPWSLRIPVAAAFGSVFFLHFSGRMGRVWSARTAR